MSKVKNAAIAVAGVILLSASMTACMDDDDATVASENVSKAADNFEVQRRITVINTESDKYLVVITGACSIDAESKQLEVICKTGKDEYKKTLVGISNRVTYTVEQGEPIKASAYHYRMTFKPQSIVPDVDFRGSTEDGPRNQD